MLPNVEKLEFTGYGREEFTFPVDQFLSMIGHPEVSMTKLTHLKLEGYAMSDDNFLRVLEKLSALTSLTFKEADGDGDEPLTARFFRSLVDRDCLGLTKTRDGRSDALVPQLTHIKLRMRSKSLPWNELHSFLESRQDSKRIHPYSIVSLLKATIYIPKFGLDQISDDSKSRFVKLRSGGLDVRIITSQK
ncbi:hypothetical protein GYMLUDRAFT_75160 [Collybiopsis luxurians FD-317 M1]|uniref:Uncharacterized protein n=1 Tax=Collybiopsis luxurians FD-317 M1 TaxID=944289 RepID=A0A0D0CRC8_9AGAR|nr:hypothetical protein GYMLUDRAFT_75160 [Collybiopsis luxurians FD-317 M1]